MLDYKPLSGSTLFHFTGDIENLMDILRSGFSPRYCLEEQKQFGIEDEIGIPMISFCDIPLSQIRKHIDYYGKYAIGLTKEWGMRNKISPIMYTIANANSSEMIRKCLKLLLKYSDMDINELINEKNNEDSLLVDLALRQYAFLSFIKIYEGKFWRHGKYLETKVRFYDEREWRYVPLFEEMLKFSIPCRLSKEKFVLDTEKKKADQLLKEYFKITFRPSDIRYIIIEKESEILEIMNKISTITDKYSSEELEILKTRIISMEQIINDF